MTIRFIILLNFIVTSLLSQPNCNAYKYNGDDLKYRACIAADARKGHYQFSKEYQVALDMAIEIDSSFAFAYKAKSTAYLKSGDFITWKELMDKAVHYCPAEFLDYRGWCRYHFFRNYKGAIADIEYLDSLLTTDIGHSVNGEYHLKIALALCYRGVGDQDKAIEIMEMQLAEEGYSPGFFDYIHLGVMYEQKGLYEQAINAFKMQQEINDLSENRYYLALIQSKLDLVKESKENLLLAHEKYKNGNRMFGRYIDPEDKIYLSQIEEEIKKNKYR